nr:4Fe-4S binding protein [Bacteroidota bacterium]
MYENILIYYFSGTGNAKHVAQWFAKVATGVGVRATLVNIDRLGKIELPELSGKTLIGFCAPTHGFNLPPIMLKFIFRFPKRKDTDVFIINTRAGMKLSKLFVPGLSGIAQLLPALVFWLKGYRIRGMQPMDLPSNWISLHPGLRQKVVDSIFERCERITKNFAERILTGGSKYKALLSLPFDLAVAPIAFGYYIIGRFAIAKTFVATNACNQCGLCVKQCPVNAIKMIRNRPYWTFKCESCMRCMNNCPERAIETAQSYTIVMWYLIVSLLFPWILKKFYSISFIHINSDSRMANTLEEIASWGIGLVIIWLGYELIHRLMRLRIFNNLVAYTSFTKYRFWRRYKAPRKQ